LPTTVISSTLEGPFDWPDATVARGAGVEIVRRMKEESDEPIRSHGSLSLNRALMAAGLVDRIQMTVFPVVAGQTGDEPICAGGGVEKMAATSVLARQRNAPSSDVRDPWPERTGRSVAGFAASSLVLGRSTRS
jgi:dihydrofolate reductase